MPTCLCVYQLDSLGDFVIRILHMQKEESSGQDSITRVCPCSWLRNPKGEITPAQQQRETGQFHGLEPRRGIHLRYKRLRSHLHKTIQELEFPIRKK